jgi:hypothetical protein
VSTALQDVRAALRVAHCDLRCGPERELILRMLKLQLRELGGPDEYLLAEHSPGFWRMGMLWDYVDVPSRLGGLHLIHRLAEQPGVELRAEHLGLTPKAANNRTARAIEFVERHHETLGSYLRRTVSSGVRVRYRPEPHAVLNTICVDGAWMEALRAGALG